MCNDFGNHIPYSDYLTAFSQTRIPVRWPTSAPNLEPREDIWPTDKAPVIRRLEDVMSRRYRRSLVGRVGMWRGGVRSTMSVAAPFV